MRRRGWASPGMSKSELAAAKIAAATFKVSLQSLLRRPKVSAPTGRRKYKYVLLLSKLSKWVVSRSGHMCPGAWIDQEAAARVAAKAFGVNLADLRLPDKSLRSRPGARRYRYVVYCSWASKWRILRKGFAHRPCYDTEEEAAKSASRLFEIPLVDLRLPKRIRVLGTESVDALRDRFRDLMQVYSTSNHDRPVLPGDPKDLLHRNSASALSLLRASPGLVVPLLWCKYGPHRDALLEVAKTHGPKRASEEVLYAIMSQTFRNLSGWVLEQAWRQNVGRKNAHHSGLVRFAHVGLRLLVPVATGRSADVVRLGMNQRTFRIARLTKPMAAKLRTLINVGKAMLRTPGPTTVNQWAAAVAKLQDVLQGPPKAAGFGSCTSYRALWVIRVWLIWMMRRAGVNRLSLGPKCTAEAFAKLFPDQRCWILKFAGRKQALLPMVDVLKNAGFTAPPELFSMFTCLFGDTDLVSALQRQAPNFLRLRHRVLVKAPGLCMALRVCCEGCVPGGARVEFPKARAGRGCVPGGADAGACIVSAGRRAWSTRRRMGWHFIRRCWCRRCCGR